MPNASQPKCPSSEAWPTTNSIESSPTYISNSITRYYSLISNKCQFYCHENQFKSFFFVNVDDHYHNGITIASRYDIKKGEIQFSTTKSVSEVLLHEKFNMAAEPGCYFVVEARMYILRNVTYYIFLPCF